MAGYTKADFDRLYSIRLRMWDESIQAYRRSPVRLGYHRAVMAEIVQAPWPKLIELLDITSDDRVVVVGAGYGWGVEKLIELTNCKAVGTDISDYIQNTQDDDEIAEVKVCVIKAGLDPSFGHGKEVMDYVIAEGAYKANVDILNEDMSTPESRAVVSKALGGDPTLIITEDMMSDLDSQASATLSAILNESNAQVVHFSRARNMTSEALNELTGDIVVEVGSMKRVG